MSDYQLETTFLKNCLLYDSSADCDKLLARMAELQSNERSVKRAGWIMVFMAGLALASLGYHAVLVTEYPATLSQFVMPWTVRICIALSVTSMICLLVFGGLGTVYRKEHNGHRQECRRLIENFLEGRFGRKASRSTIA
jgi:hypothetical protein